MQPMFQLIARRCFEHGLSHALDSVAKHTSKLHAASDKQWRREPNQVDTEYSYFEFKLLVAGLTMASLVFVGELLSVVHWPKLSTFWVRSGLVVPENTN